MSDRLQAEKSANLDYAQLLQKKQGLSNDLAHYIDRLNEIHSHLKRSYDDRALEKLGKYFCDVGSRFNSLAFAYGDPYRDWVDKSAESRNLARHIEEKAYQVARVFEEGYSRTRCRQLVTDLINTMRNLKFVNDRR